MLRLTIDRRQAQLTSLNCRAESIGPKEKRLAIDIGLSLSFEGGILDEFSPHLHEALFDRQTQDLAGGCVRRFPEAAPIEWQGEMTGAKVAFDIGISKPIEFADARINKFTLSPMDGGTVILSLRVQCHPSEDQVGPLAGHLQQGITFSLTPMELPVMAEQPEAPKRPKGKKLSKAEAGDALQAEAAKLDAAEAEGKRIAATTDGEPITTLQAAAAAVAADEQAQAEGAAA